MADVVPFINKEEAIRKLLLTDLERLSEGLNGEFEKAIKVQSLVMDQIKDAVERKTMTPYKSAVALSKAFEVVSKMAMIRMGIFDRLNGTIGAYGVPIEESEEEFENPSIEVQREAEKIVYEIVKAQVEARKRGEIA